MGPYLDHAVVRGRLASACAVEQAAFGLGRGPDIALPDVGRDVVVFFDELYGDGWEGGHGRGDDGRALGREDGAACE